MMQLLLISTINQKCLCVGVKLVYHEKIWVKIPIKRREQKYCEAEAHYHSMNSHTHIYLLTELT